MRNLTSTVPCKTDRSPYRVARLWTFLVVLLSCSAAHAQLTPPSNVDFELTSLTEDYHFYIDNDPSSADYYSPLKAFFDILAVDRLGAWGIGNPQGYDHGYELLGFVEPDFNGGERAIFSWDCQADGCDNGFATNNRIVMPAPFYGNQSLACTCMVLGHELFHHIQNVYKRQGTHSYFPWVFEGMARAMQDKIYDDIDTDPAVSCIAGYLGEVEDYLRGPPPVQEQSIWNTGYDAALWWTYLMEQFGGVTDGNPIYTLEPVVGTDFIRAWYETAVANGVTGNSVATTNDTIQSFNPTTDIYRTFQRFSIANLMKDMDLSQNSEGFRRVYSYLDEQPNGPIDQDAYAEVVFTDTLSVSNANTTDSTGFLVSGLATKYYDVDISECAPGRLITVDITSNFPIPAAVSSLGLWGVVVGQSTDGSGDIGTLRLAKFKRVIADDWATTFFQPANPYERAFVTISGPLLPVAGAIEVTCGVPETIGPDLPLVTTINPLTPGLPDQFGVGEVCAVPVNPIADLDPTDYTISSGGDPLSVLARSPRDEGHCLLFEVPPSSTTVQDLTVSLGGQSATIAGGIVRSDPAPNVLIAVNTSSSMLLPPDEPVLEDVKAMLGPFVRQLMPVDGSTSLPKIGLIDFAGDLFEPNMDALLVQPLVASDRDGLVAFDSAVAGLSSGPGRFTALGDAIRVAMDEFATRGDPDQRKHLVLITDSPESEGAFWADIRDTVLDTGYVLHVIAIGSGSDQPLAYDVARSTGGRFAYVPVSSASADHVAMADEFAALAAAISGRARLAGQAIPVTDSAFDFTFAVPPQAIGLLLPAVQAAREAADDGGILGKLTLTPPQGQPLEITLMNVLVTSYQTGSGQDGPPPPGIWHGRFTPEPGGSGTLRLGAVVDRDVPLVIQTAFGDLGNGRSGRENPGIALGESKSINAVFYDGCAQSSLCDSALPDQPIITGRIPNSSEVSIVPDLHDIEPPSATRGEGKSKFYQLVLANSQGADTTSGGDDRVGAYHFQLEIAGLYDGYTVRFLASDSYVVDVSIPVMDTDGDGLSDTFEAGLDCLDASVSDATLDPDNDGLPSVTEFDLATNPCEGDTDRGGELDGSEVAGGRDPLLRTDDKLPGVAFLTVDHEITHAERDTVLPPSSITLAFGNSGSYHNLTLKRGLPSQNEPVFDSFFDIDASSSDGTYVDTTVAPGTEYCYQLEASDVDGNSARPSEILCTVAAVDPALPWGDLVINDGRPRTTNPMLTLDVRLYNKNPTTSEMRVEVEGTSSGWIPYAPQHTVTVPASAAARHVFVSIQLRHDGGQSPLYTDSIHLWPAGSLGSMTGRVLREGEGSGDEPGLAGVLIYLDAEAEPPAYTDATGQFWFHDLEPGQTSASAGDLDWSTLEGFADAVIVAGETVDVGTHQLPLGPDQVFVDGFE